MECRSFFNTSGNSESDNSLKSGLDWSISVADRNLNWSNILLDELEIKATFESIVEIGCGIGTLLETAKKRGIKVIGFDTNSFAASYGRENLGIDLRSEFWNSGTLSEKYDLLISISVLEHLETPRTLFKEIAHYCQRYKSSAFLSLPFLDFDRWHYIFDPDPLKEGTPFFDNDSHVTHFSREGFIKMCKQFGSKSQVPLVAGGWSGFLVSF